MITVSYIEYNYADFHYAQCHYDRVLYTKCCYAEFNNTYFHCAQSHYTKDPYGKCCYTECFILSIMMRIYMMLIVIMLKVVAPIRRLYFRYSISYSYHLCLSLTWHKPPAFIENCQKDEISFSIFNLYNDNSKVFWRKETVFATFYFLQNRLAASSISPLALLRSSSCTPLALRLRSACAILALRLSSF